MSDPIADSQLELACRLGSIDDILEALEDGADINCNGHSPIFTAVMANDRPVVEVLVKQGADVSPFELPAGLSEVEEIVNALVGMAPKTGEESAQQEEEIDAKQLRAFDRMIRNKGLGEPLLKKRGDEYPAVVDALQRIAAEECHDVVVEFLALMEAAKSGGAVAGLGGESADAEDAAGDAGPGAGEAAASAGDFDLGDFLESNAARIAELSERYVSAEELPGDLLKEYLKEMKKLAG